MVVKVTGIVGANNKKELEVWHESSEVSALPTGNDIAGSSIAIDTDEMVVRTYKESSGEWVEHE